MKLVKEHINFKRGEDPMKAMSIGKYRDLQKGDELKVYDREYNVYRKAKVIELYFEKGIETGFNVNKTRLYVLVYHDGWQVHNNAFWDKEKEFWYI